MTSRANELRTYEILIPLAEDGTGVLHPQETFDRWQDETANMFGGLTSVGIVDGAWLDADRRAIVRDKSRAYLLGIDPGREDDLIQHAALAAETFGQKCIFLERRGTAFLVSRPTRTYVTDQPEMLFAREAEVTYAAEPGLTPTEVTFIEAVRRHIANGTDYITLLDRAFGPSSPLLRGAPYATPRIRQRSAYQLIRDEITEYGRSQGLLRRSPAENVALVAESEPPPYGGVAAGSLRPRCVSQYHASRVLGWTLDQVRDAMRDGRLRARDIDGAQVVEEASLGALS